MFNWNINPTMKKLGKLCPVCADTPEGNEIKELIDGMIKNDMKLDAYMLADYAYTLGIARGKQLDRARRKASK